MSTRWFWYSPSMHEVLGKSGKSGEADLCHGDEQPRPVRRRFANWNVQLFFSGHHRLPVFVLPGDRLATHVTDEPMNDLGWTDVHLVGEFAEVEVRRSPACEHAIRWGKVNRDRGA